MTDLAAAAGELFQILRSFDYTVMLYDADGNRVQDTGDARRLYDRSANLEVSLIDDGDNSAVKLITGEKNAVDSIMGLIQTLRTAATKFNLLFNVRAFGREISPEEIASGAVTEAAQPDLPLMQIVEGMYGTSKSSYLKFEGVDGGRGARMIVRHSAKIDETKPGARGRYVENIFIENPKGERLLFPTQQLAPARAMTQHVNHGGSFIDPVGSRIQEMATEYHNLSAASRHVKSHAGVLAEGAMAVREACRQRMREHRQTFGRMFRTSGYMAECEKINAAQSALTEGGGDTNAVSPEEINEMRGLLAVEGTEVDECICEAACRATRAPKQDSEMMTDEMQEGEIEEGFKEEILPTVTVLGKPVEKGAWEDLTNGKLETFRKPDLTDAPPDYPNRSWELNYKLEKLVPVVKNISMSNFLSFVSTQLAEPLPPDRKVKFARVARAAVTAGGLPLNEGLSPNNKVIKEFAGWLGEFRTDRALAEDYGDLRRFSRNPYDDEADFGQIVTRAMKHFDAHEFASEFLADNFDAGEEDNDKVVSKDYLLSCIEHRLIHLVQREDDMAAPHSLPHEAASLLKPVEAALLKLGFRVGEPHLMEEFELSREDILLPRADQGQDLRHEVIKPEVTDPVDGEEEDVDSSYLARLRTLSGM